jgi:hypothetical protein
MLVPTDYTVDLDLLQQVDQPSIDLTINRPLGDFFYGTWVLKDEYRGTVWETFYDSLPVPKGEARVILLPPGSCYQSHADIDDRYHLNISGEDCYLIDLIRQQMHATSQDGRWYHMDAGYLHTAVNFGRYARAQLVIRKPLRHNNLTNPCAVTILSSLPADDCRFIFDNSLSAWLNAANKAGHIMNFSHDRTRVKFDVDYDQIGDIERILPTGFSIHTH